MSFGSLAIVGLVDPIDEEEDDGETLNVVLVCQFVFNSGVDLSESKVVRLELGDNDNILRCEGLAVATPWRVELDHDEVVVSTTMVKLHSFKMMTSLSSTSGSLNTSFDEWLKSAKLPKSSSSSLSSLLNWLGSRKWPW